MGSLHLNPTVHEKVMEVPDSDQQIPNFPEISYRLDPNGNFWLH